MKSTKAHLMARQIRVIEALSKSSSEFNRFLLLSYVLTAVLCIANWQDTSNMEFSIQGMKTPVNPSSLQLFIAAALLLSQFCVALQFQKFSTLYKRINILYRDIKTLDPTACPLPIGSTRYCESGMFGVIMAFARSLAQGQFICSPFYSSRHVQQEESLSTVQRKTTPSTIGLFVAVGSFIVRIVFWLIKLLLFIAFQQAVLLFPLYYTWLNLYSYADVRALDNLHNFLFFPGTGLYLLALFYYTINIGIATFAGGITLAGSYILSVVKHYRTKVAAGQVSYKFFADELDDMFGEEVLFVDKANYKNATAER